jgi:hypothetical protein
MLKCLIALTSLLSAAAFAAPAWTWVDEQGRRHYSDRPVEGATQIELAGPQTFTSAPVNPATSESATSEETLVAPYSVLDVISPTNEQSFSNIGGSLTAELAIYPPLQAAHRIDAILDGEHVEIGARNLTIVIPDVFRGEHTIQAVIMGSDGEELMRSMPITVFVRQTSIARPN